MRAPWMMFTIQNTGVQNTPMKMVPLQRQKSVVRLHQPTSASASYWMVIAHAVHAVQPAGIAGRGFTQKLDEEFGTVIIVVITRRRSVVSAALRRRRLYSDDRNNHACKPTVRMQSNSR